MYVSIMLPKIIKIKLKKFMNQYMKNILKYLKLKVYFLQIMIIIEVYLMG